MAAFKGWKKLKLKPGRGRTREEPSKSVYFQCNMNISDLLLMGRNVVWTAETRQVSVLTG